MDQLLQWIESYGTPAIILLIALEYACFPISSELVLPFAGAFGAGIGLSLPLLILYSSAAGLAGTSLTYAIGRYGGSPLLEKIMARFPSSKKPILASYRTFGDRGRLAVCVGRVIPICRTYIAFVAGACGQSYPAYVGYYFYNYRDIFFHYFDKYKTFILIIGLLLILLLLFSRKTETEEEI